MYTTKTKPQRCTDCFFAKAHSFTKDRKIIRACSVLGGCLNERPDETVLENCPLPDGTSEEEYTTVREGKDNERN